MSLFEYKTNKVSGFDVIGEVFKFPVDKFVLDNFSKYNPDESGRFDLTSYRLTQDVTNWDRLMKINGVQDPFLDTVDADFIVPSKTYLSNIFVNKAEFSLSSSKGKNYLINNNSVISVIDSGRQSRINSVLYKFGESVTELRKPIYLKTGEEQITVKDGIISI